MTRLFTAALAASLLALTTVPAAAQDLGALDAVVSDIDKKSAERRFPTITSDGRTGDTGWRVVLQTGNCCENYVTTTADGRLIDFGGSYANFSDDRGATWKQAAPVVPYISGEGAVVTAPNGDILGVGWDPYSGDRLQAFKYEAATKKWRYKDIALHQPFYDREWIGVVPGPITLPTGETVPYVSFIRGAYPNKDLYLMSSDGLTYVQSPGGQIALTTSDLQALPVQADATFDWIQPNTESTFTALGAGRALSGPGYLKNGYTVFDPESFMWETYAPESGGPQGLVQSDSRGRLHDVVPGDSTFTYRMSDDGGATWQETKVPLGGNITIENIDYRVHAGLGIAAVGLHTHDEAAKSDRDLLYKLDVTGDSARVTRVHQVGLADVNGSSGVTADIRFDFETVALFPDGRAVLSFYDTKTESVPAIAIERDTDLPGEPDAPPVPGGIGGTGDPGSPVVPVATPAPAAPAATPAPAAPAPSRLALTLKGRRNGRRATLSGVVKPAFAGITVLIERKAGKRWIKVTRTQTDAAGRFRAVRTVTRGARLRAVVRGSAERPGATSRIVRLR